MRAHSVPASTPGVPSVPPGSASTRSATRGRSSATTTTARSSRRPRSRTRPISPTARTRDRARAVRSSTSRRARVLQRVSAACSSASVPRALARQCSARLSLACMFASIAPCADALAHARRNRRPGPTTRMSVCGIGHGWQSGRPQHAPAVSFASCRTSCRQVLRCTHCKTGKGRLAESSIRVGSCPPEEVRPSCRRTVGRRRFRIAFADLISPT